MRRRSILFLFAFFLLTQAGAAAQGLGSNAPQHIASNTLRGKVRSIDGVVVNNAIVELRGGGGVISQTVTRNDGDFLFSNLVSGEYEVAVMGAGYETTVQIARFNVNDRMALSEVLNIEILIKPKREPLLLAPGTNFVQDVPKPARAAYERGISRLRDGKYDQGVAALREAITKFDDYFDAHFALGKEFFRAGKDNEPQVMVYGETGQDAIHALGTRALYRA